MREYAFEKLIVWQEARELTKLIYQITACFPETEKFGLTNQMRRAAVSVASNIAEGSGRRGAKEQQDLQGSLQQPHGAFKPAYFGLRSKLCD